MLQESFWPTQLCTCHSILRTTSRVRDFVGRRAPGHALMGFIGGILGLQRVYIWITDKKMELPLAPLGYAVMIEPPKHA